MSTESITTSPPAPADSQLRCSSCTSPVAADQRYCLECGERQMPRSSFLLGGPESASPASGPPPKAPPKAPGGAAADDAAAKRTSTLTALAGIGLLLLAMGVGVLIGRAGNSKQSAPAAQVITVGSVGGGASAAASEATYTSDWPSGTTGYTVQLQTLPSSGTAVAQVQAAKTAATAKGAASVGALKSDEFTSLTAGSYVIYSGVYHSKAEAEKARPGLAKSFPAAKVIDVSNKSSGGEPAESSSSGSGSGVGESLNNPAPPSTLKTLKGAKGKTYEEKSKNLPNVIETG